MHQVTGVARWYAAGITQCQMSSCGGSGVSGTGSGQTLRVRNMSAQVRTTNKKSGTRVLVDTDHDKSTSQELILECLSTTLRACSVPQYKQFVLANGDGKRPCATQVPRINRRAAAHSPTQGSLGSHCICGGKTSENHTARNLRFRRFGTDELLLTKGRMCSVPTHTQVRLARLRMPASQICTLLYPPEVAHTSSQTVVAATWSSPPFQTDFFLQKSTAKRSVSPCHSVQASLRHNEIQYNRMDCLPNKRRAVHASWNLATRATTTDAVYQRCSNT